MELCCDNGGSNYDDPTEVYRRYRACKRMFGGELRAQSQRLD